MYLYVPSLYSLLFPSAMLSGARVHTNSWGSYDKSYSEMTYDVDAFTYENKDLIVLFAAGNAGTAGYGSLASPGNAKNALTVGAISIRDPDHDYVLDEMEVTWFSGLGPTIDERIKPDVVAAGGCVLSAFAAGGDPTSREESCGVISKMGTSMSTPVVAGIALLIRQYFMDEQFWATICNKLYETCQGGSFTPSGYLLKAMIIHSGKPVKRYSNKKFDVKTFINSFELSNAPDYMQGYGSVTLTNILPLGNDTGLPAGVDLIVWDELNITEFSTLRFDIIFDNLNGTSPLEVNLKITISWYDPPSTVGFVSDLLINDLDLLVISPTGQPYWGNGFLESDEKNVNEQVVLPSSSYCLPGEDCVYRAYVHCNALPESDWQSFALVITTNGNI